MFNKANGKKVIIVTGMHRSGTSAFTNLLMHNNIDMGPAKDANFESRLYSYDLSYFLNFLGATWDMPFQIRRKSNSIYKHAADLFIKKIESRIGFHQKTTFKKFIGFKNPISTLLIPELSCIKNSVIINIDRDIDEIVKSLMRRKPRARLNLFPGHYGFGMEVDDESRMFELTKFYKKVIDENRQHIALSIKYDDLLDPKKKSMLETKLADVIGTQITIPNEFFVRRSY